MADELVEDVRALATEEQRVALERALVDRTETEILGARMGDAFALANRHLDLAFDVVRYLLRPPSGWRSPSDSGCARSTAAIGDQVAAPPR